MSLNYPQFILEEHQVLCLSETDGRITANPLTYTAFHQYLKTPTSTEAVQTGGVSPKFLELLNYYGVDKLVLPPNNYAVHKVSNGYRFTHIVGGEEFVFPKLDLDNSIIRIDYTITQDKKIPRDSIRAYRYIGVRVPNAETDSNSIYLPSLTALLREIHNTESFNFSTGKRTGGIADLARVTPRTRIGQRVRTLPMTNGEIQWEGVEW